jgi:hypothetical protein
MFFTLAACLVEWQGWAGRLVTQKEKQIDKTDPSDCVMCLTAEGTV